MNKETLNKILDKLAPGTVVNIPYKIHEVNIYKDEDDIKVNIMFIPSYNLNTIRYTSEYKSYTGEEKASYITYPQNKVHDRAYPMVRRITLSDDKDILKLLGVKEEKEENDDILDGDLHRLFRKCAKELGLRSAGVHATHLERNGIFSLRDLIKLSEKDVKRLKEIGNTGYLIIVTVVKFYGLKFRED